MAELEQQLKKVVEKYHKIREAIEKATTSSPTETSQSSPTAKPQGRLVQQPAQPQKERQSTQ